VSTAFAFRRTDAIELGCFGQTLGKAMVVELALAHALPKPWGVVDLLPWSKAGYNGETIGEIWSIEPITRA